MPLSPHVPDLAALDLFVAVARLGSIGAAAREAGISQQAASARLAAMESQVGTALLARDPRGSRVTAAGALLADWAAPLLALAGELDTGIASLRRERDAQLRVASSLTIAEHLLPGWLVALRRDYAALGRPGAEVTLMATNSQTVAVQVAERLADIGFVEGPVPPQGLRSATIARDRLVVVVPPRHPWARARSALTAEELASTPLVEREAGSGTRQFLRTALEACLGHRADLAAPALALTTTTAVRQAVRAGAGPAVLSLLAVREALAAGTLAVVPVAGLDLNRRLRAVWAGPPQPPAGPARDLLAVARRIGVPRDPG
ncbi:MAG: LysR family transcriptional regulator [Streptosporangiaceae bacterium]